MDSQPEGIPAHARTGLLVWAKQRGSPVRAYCGLRYAMHSKEGCCALRAKWASGILCIVGGVMWIQMTPNLQANNVASNVRLSLTSNTLNVFFLSVVVARHVDL